jgi:hypothetical protein
MTRAEARDLISARILSAWTGAGEPASTIAWENTAFQPGPGPWARPSIQFADTEDATLDGAMFVRSGIVAVQVFTPMDVGPGASDILVQAMEDAFKGALADGIHYMRARSRYVGRAESEEGEDTHFQTNVLVDFDFTEVLP